MKPIFVFLLGGTLVGVLMWAFISTSSNNVRQVLTEHIIFQESTLKQLLRATDANETDEVASRIINGCSGGKQQRFDTLLNNLASLTNAELLEASDLIFTCGDILSSNKIYMVSLLERELQQLRFLYELQSEVVEEEYDQSSLLLYEQLVALEGERAESLNNFVLIQNDIITQLLAGSVTESDDVQALSVKAQEEREIYAVLRAQIKDLHKQL